MILVLFAGRSRLRGPVTPLVHIHTFAGREEAALAQGKLRSAGITSRVVRANPAAVLPTVYRYPYEDNELWVKAFDAERARRLLGV
jgi:hypothetical protein